MTNLPTPEQHTSSDAQPSESAQWSQVVGLVAANELPTAPTDLGDCVIAPLHQPIPTPRPHEGLLFTPAAPNITSVVTIEPEVRFTAMHAITTVVPGDLRDTEARELARARFDRAIGLIAIAQGPEQPPPLFRIVSVTPVPPGTKQGDQIQFHLSAPTQMKVSPMIVNPISKATLARFTSIDGMARREPSVATLVRLWGAAERADRLRFSDADRDACQVHHCKVIEQIAIAMDLGRFEPTEAVLTDVVATVQQELKSDTSVVAKAKAIEAANAKLRQERVDGMLNRCRKALEVLAVESSLRDAALVVVKLRNTRAGHPSPSPVTESQVTDARWIAAELVRRYFNWRWEQPSATSP